MPASGTEDDQEGALAKVGRYQEQVLVLVAAAILADDAVGPSFGPMTTLPGFVSKVGWSLCFP
jgi:hypothetical protein